MSIDFGKMLYTMVFLAWKFHLWDCFFKNSLRQMSLQYKKLKIIKYVLERHLAWPFLKKQCQKTMIYEILSKSIDISMILSV